jgi:hypothetical protein
MTLPTLRDWDSTRVGLQRAAQVLAAIRQSALPPQPNSLQLGLPVEAQGLTSGPLPFGGDLLLDFAALTIDYRQPGEPSFRVSLTERSQRVLAATVLEMLAAEGHDLMLDSAVVGDDAILTIDPVSAREYADVLDTVYTALARFRAQLSGPLTPLVVWPHGFDLSFLWFARGGFDEQADPHLAFGFAPTSAGLDRPYFYAYASSAPDLSDHALPAPARSINGPYNGVYVGYDDIARVADPVGAIERLMGEVVGTLEPLL